MSEDPGRSRPRGARRARRLLRIGGVLGAVWLVVLAAVVLTSLMALLVPVGPAPAATALPRVGEDGTVHCAGGALHVVAHPDDDLLFQSPDLLRDVQAGRCVRTVYLTAGDAGRAHDYWSAREAGIRAAYAFMAGVVDEWDAGVLEVADRPVELATARAAPQLSLVFLRLPDGGRTGTGSVRYGGQSLMRLWQGEVEVLTAVDGAHTFTRGELIGTLAGMIDEYLPTTVRTQDWTRGFLSGDGADHTATALLVREAARSRPGAYTLLAYGGYPVWTRPPNVVGQELRVKAAAVATYARQDDQMCLRPWCTVAWASSSRVERQYVLASHSPQNLARAEGVVVRASSESPRTGQHAGSAVDGVAAGSPGSRSQEWRTLGGGAGSWWEIRWPAPVEVNGLVLHDRPNERDHVLGAVVHFDDESSVRIGALANNGSALSVSFPPRTTASLRIEITDVSPSTRDAGLAEVEIYGTMPDLGSLPDPEAATDDGEVVRPTAAARAGER